MSAGFGSRMSLGVRLSLLFAACTAAVSLIAGLIFSRAIDEHFVELDHLAMSAKLAVFRDELRGLGSEQQMRRREAELLREGSLSLPGDRGMLRRVLANLLDNALRFTADGGEIRIRLGDRRLSVENQGPAIPPERLPRLFDRFYRADPARREGQGEHAGLGLAICRSIVQAHGGEIRCESADGWTRFVIDFARPRR